MRENRAKQKLQDGEPVVVAFGNNSADMIDFLGPLEFDAVRIEMEHGSATWAELGDMSRACDLWGISSIARVPANEDWIIGRTLDLGVHGIIVPHVNTKEEAIQAVTAAKYAPIGHRGVGIGRLGYGVKDYLTKANDEIIIVIMVEDIVGIRNLKDILTVDDIDVFVVARGDLAHSMGYLGQIRHPEVAATYDKAVAQIIASGRTAGVQVTDSDVDKYMEMGVRYLSTSWHNWVTAGASNFLNKVNHKRI